MTRVGRLFLFIAFLSAGNLSVAQTDSSLRFYTGDLGEQDFELSEVRVRRSCTCSGVCCCAKKQESVYTGNRFVSTDILLSRDPSIELIRRGAFALEPVLNGMSTDRMNITIDGMKIFGACTDKMDPITSYVEPNNMKSVAVLQGSAGALFGSSIAGTLNMETQGASIRPSMKWTGEVGTGYNSAAKGISHLYALNRSGAKWAVSSNGVYRKFGNYRSGHGERIPFTQFEKWNNSFSAKYMPRERQILRLDLIIDEGYNIGYAALPMDVLYAKARIGGISLEQFYQKGFFERGEFKFYANRVKHAMDDTDRPDVPMHMEMPGLTETIGSYADLRYKRSAHKGILRLDLFRTRSRAEMTMFPAEELPMFMLTWPDIVKQSAGVYLRDVWELRSGNRIGVNFRFDFVSSQSVDQFGIAQASVFNQNIGETDLRFLRNAGLSYTAKLKQNWKYWVTCGFVERSPSTTEQYAFYIFNAMDGYDYIGNRSIRNEKAWQSDLGLEWKRSRITWIVSAFHYRIQDYIMGKIEPEYDAMTIGARGVKMTTNLPSALLTGARTILSYQVNRNFELNGKASYTYGTIPGGDPLPMIAPMRNVLSCRWTGNKMFLQLETEAAAGQNRVNPDFGEQTTPAYTLIHFRSGYTVKTPKGRLILNGGVENLFDRHYRTHLTWGGIPQPGINAFLNVNYAFN